MKQLHPLPAALLAIAVARDSDAKVGAMDVVPASTLLLPYFEVDPADPDNANTVINVSAATATAILAHVTLWTDYGIPTHRFDVYLTGFDTATIDLRLLFQHGLVSRTASDGQDPADDSGPLTGISNQGALSQDVNFPTCDGVLPYKPLSRVAIDDLKKAHTGQPAARFGGQCGGAALNDGVARGYVTIDTVARCTDTSPGEGSYFRPVPQGSALATNRITGTFTFVKRKDKVAYAGRLASIEASTTDPLTDAPADRTFYRTWSRPENDHREPLPTAWQVHYYNGTKGSGVPAKLGPFADGPTQLLVWRDPGVKAQPFACAQGKPAGLPLTGGSILAYDQQENVTSLPMSPLLGRVAQRMATDDPALGVPYRAGFLQLSFGEQSFVSVVQQAAAAKLAVSSTAFPVTP